MKVAKKIHLQCNKKYKITRNKSKEGNISMWKTNKKHN